MKKKRIALLILLSLFFVQFIHSNLKVGERSPIFSGLQLLDKQPDLTNKFVVIDFWATWCIPCIQSFPHLNGLADKYQSKIVFLTISDEKESIVRNFLQRVKLEDSSTFKNVYFGLDTRSEINIGFGVKYIPTYFLISPDNIILSTGNSAELNESYLDSVIANYGTSSSNKRQTIAIRPDSVEKVSSIQITSQPGSTRNLRIKENSLLIRDTLRHILPYLDGVRLANRVRWEGIPKDMIEVNIYSGKAPVSSLKEVAHDMIMKSYGIHKKVVVEKKFVWTMKVKDKSKLQDSTTISEDGVMKRNMLLNDSIYQCDNFSLQELGGLIENFYFPTIIYVNTLSNKSYDWNLKIINKKTKQAVDFDRFREVMLRDYGIEFNKSVKKEKITVYY
ncbi:MAG: TlpA disulfide reductase family protein [Bacteroidales bacterium]|nr:TlpA disulfide reductase family protein [Bacteroidales bacterium]